MNQNSDNIIAIDISKMTLDIRTDKIHFTCANSEYGFKEISNRLALESSLVVCESTGGYERNLVDFIHSKEAPITVVNPRRIRGFAISEGIKAKSDPIDTKVILKFAKEKDLRLTPKPDPMSHELMALLDRKSHLSEQLTKEKNRRQNTFKRIESSIDRMILIIKNEIKDINKQINSIIESREEFTEKLNIMTEVSGVGHATAETILAYLPEIGHLKRNEIVALVGLAPFNQDSGKSRKKRRISGGRKKVRKCLYMAAKTAAIHNDVIKPYVEKLRARGFSYNSALTAAMRKILIYLHILIKNYNLSLD